MKRILLIGFALVLALGVAVAPAAAVPAEELSALAAYFPSETPAFFAMRTDDAFIDELDALMETLSEALPPGMLPPFTLREALDEGMTQMGGDDATFDNTIRTWLGDSMAVGVLSLESTMSGRGGNPPMLIAFDITDRDAALAFIEQSYSVNDVDVETEEVRGYTVVTPEHPTNAFFAVGDDVAFLSTERDLLPLNSDFRSLADDAEFAESVAALPASDYNLLLALNLQEMVSMSYDMMQMQSEAFGPAADLILGMEALYRDYPRQALGFTILDDTSLTIDFVQGAIDFSALEGPLFENAAAMLNSAPVDFDFASHIPADAPFAIQGTSFGNSVTYAIEVVSVMAEIGMQQGMMSRRFDGREDVPVMIQEMDANDVRAFIDLAFAGMTGLNLQDDVLPHLNGNAAAFGRVLPSEATEFTFDAALVFEVTDAAAMQAIMDQLVVALDRYEADYSVEEGGVLVLPGVIRGAFPERFQEDLDAEATFDFLIGLNDEVFAIGSREAVEFALNGDGDSLADDPAFATARSHFLADSQQVGYLGFAPLRALLDDVMANAGPAMSNYSSVGLVQTVLEALYSASYSAAVADDGTTVGRLVLTLAD